MNLLFLTHHRPHLVRFRAGAFAREMAAKGHQVTIVCISENAKFKPRRLQLDGVSYLESPDLLPGKMRSGWDPWNTAWRIGAIKKLWDQADAIHAFETRPTTIFPILWHQKRNPKPLLIDWNDWWGRGGLITELRPKWYQRLFGGMETWFEEHYRHRADITTLISHGLVDRALHLHVKQDTIHVITGGADHQHFQAVDSQAHRPAHDLPADHLLCCFSALDVTMDAKMAIDAFAQASKTSPNLRLMLVMRKSAQLTQLLKSAGVADKVYQLGIFPYEQLPPVLACADLFLLPFPDKPANRGRWPNKVMDYLSCGRPVITHPTGEMAKLFADSAAGVLVEETPEAMAAAMLELAADPERRRQMGQAGRHLAETTYSWPFLAERLQNCYDLAMTPHG